MERGNVEPERWPAYRAGLLFHGRQLVEAVGARDGAHAYWVEEVDGRAVETPLLMRALPSREELEPPVPLSITEWRETRRRRR